MSELHQGDFDLLREAFAEAQAAREAGDHPFGAILAGPDGDVLMRQGNGYRTEGQDMTAHAERVLATRASKAHRPDFLAACTMYVSAEPCAMCAGAIYWSGIGRVVYGQSEADLKRQIDGLRRIQNSKLLALWRDHAHLRDLDAVVASDGRERIVVATLVLTV